MARTPVKIVTVCVLTMIVVGAAGVFNEPDAGRLPRDTEPVAYSLQLAPKYDNDTDAYEFGGQVEILIRVNHITADVTLNARDMIIKHVMITEYETQVDLPLIGFEMIDANDFLVIHANANLLTGRQYQLKVVFVGRLRADMTGFYKSSYMVDNVKKWMAVTQFKYAYARRAFPCYDDPVYKTPFNVSLGRLQNQMSRSNMPCYLTQRLQYYGWWVDHFETTPPIPTYLVGAIVGELKKKESGAEDYVNVYTYGDYVTQTEYVTGETPALIGAMENYTGSRSVVNKLDMLAVPDFDADGVENWGLNAYRERYVLFDDDSKAKFREQSTMAVQQQQTHQWFGNLVTCEWWSFMWLNEGFSRYFQYFMTAMVKPDWRLEELFVVEQHQPALEFDQIPRHSMTATVITVDDIQHIIDRVTYDKAAAVLRMIRHVVSDVNFRKPLMLYLRNFKYGVTRPEDLWAVFENYYFDTGFRLRDNVPFTNFVVSWTDQSGYPVIHVSRTANTFKITQKKFSIWPSDDNRTMWYIGVTYTTNENPNFNDLSPVKWLKPTMPYLYINDLDLFDWYIFNLQSSGFYRVNYDKENWNELIQQLNGSHSIIHVLNRAQLIDDSFNLARAGLLKYSTALDLSMYLTHEDDIIPWYTAIDCLSYVVERMRRSVEGYDYIMSYVQNLADLIYKKTEAIVLKNDTKDHSILTSWNKFSIWACSLNGEYCTRSAMEYFQKWTMKEKISPDIKDAALCVGVKLSNDTKAWKQVLNVYTTSKSASEKNSAQSALTCSRNPSILYKYLDFIFNADSNGPVRLQDFKDICAAMSLTPQGIEALTNFLMNNLEKILRTVPTGQSIVEYIYSVLASKVVMDYEIIKLYELKSAPELPPKIKASFDESYVHVEQNLRWYNLYHVSINQWTGAPAEPKSSTPETISTESTATTPVTTSTEPTATAPVTTKTEPTTMTPVTTTTEPTTTDPITTVTELTTTTSVMTTIEPAIPSENATSSSTTILKGNATSSTIERFDFDNTTPAIISRCPNKSSQPSYRRPGLVLIVTVVIATHLCLFLHS